MKNEIWFDVDDVLVDTAKEIHRVFLSRTGQDVPIETWPSLYFSKFYNIGDNAAEIMRGWWKEDKMLENAQPHETAISLIQELASKGYRIGLITARAWHPDAKLITEDFIHQNKLPVSELKLLRFEESKKELLKPNAKNIVAFIDDSPHHVQGAMELEIPSVLMRRAWNVEQRKVMPHIGHLNEMSSHFKINVFKEDISKKTKLKIK